MGKNPRWVKIQVGICPIEKCLSKKLRWGNSRRKKVREPPLGRHSINQYLLIKNSATLIKKKGFDVSKQRVDSFNIRAEISGAISELRVQNKWTGMKVRRARSANFYTFCMHILPMNHEGC